MPVIFIQSTIYSINLQLLWMLSCKKYFFLVTVPEKFRITAMMTPDIVSHGAGGSGPVKDKAKGSADWTEPFALFLVEEHSGKRHKLYLGGVLAAQAQGIPLREGPEPKLHSL